MDPIPLTPLLLASSFLLICSVVGFIHAVCWKPWRLEKLLKQQGIRGTPYRPLVGDLRRLARLAGEARSRPIVGLSHRIAPRVDPFTHDLVNNFGNIALCWNGKSPRLIIKDPEILKEVLSNRLGHFGKPPLNPQVLILARGLTTLEGESWARHRRLISPAFHLDRLKGMIPDFTAGCRRKIEQWESAVNDQGAACEVDAWLEFQDMTGEIISRTAFGSSYENGKRILELLKELQLLAMEAMQNLYLPGFRFIPTTKNRRRRDLDRKITSMLRDLVRAKEDDMKRGDDLLGLLLNDNSSSTKIDGTTVEEVIEECKVFYLAGHETTASLLTWTVVVLGIHQDWQRRAREEVLRICLRNEPDFDAITHLKTVAMVLQEVQRLYPSVIALYQHAYQETKVGDITVPAGVDVTLPLLLMNHDPELWGPDAAEFNPERFSEGASKASQNRPAFFPFGWGPITCIGQSFAMIEVKVALSMILQRFAFELSPSYAHAPHAVMTLQPQHGAQVLLRRL